MDKEKLTFRIPRVPRRSVLAGILFPLTKTVHTSEAERVQIAERNISTLPETILNDLRARTSKIDPTPFGDELSAGRFFVSENNQGKEVGRAILQLYSEDADAIAPDLAEAQLYWLLSNSSHGRRLSINERESIVALSNWWPETFTPYYRDGDGLRQTLVERLREYPSLARAFERLGRRDVEVADVTGRRVD